MRYCGQALWPKLSATAVCSSVLTLVELVPSCPSGPARIQIGVHWEDYVDAFVALFVAQGAHQVQVRGRRLVQQNGGSFRNCAVPPGMSRCGESLDCLDPPLARCLANSASTSTDCGTTWQSYSRTACETPAKRLQQPKKICSATNELSSYPKYVSSEWRVPQSRLRLPLHLAWSGNRALLPH